MIYRESGKEGQDDKENKIDDDEKENGVVSVRPVTDEDFYYDSTPILNNNNNTTNTIPKNTPKKRNKVQCSQIESICLFVG